MMDRFVMMFMPAKHHPDVGYVRKVSYEARANYNGLAGWGCYHLRTHLFERKVALSNLPLLCGLLRGKLFCDW